MKKYEAIKGLLRQDIDHSKLAETPFQISL